MRGLSKAFGGMKSRAPVSSEAIHVCGHDASWALPMQHTVEACTKAFDDAGFDLSITATPTGSTHSSRMP